MGECVRTCLLTQGSHVRAHCADGCSRAPHRSGNVSFVMPHGATRPVGLKARRPPSAVACSAHRCPALRVACGRTCLCARAHSRTRAVPHARAAHARRTNTDARAILRGRAREHGGADTRQCARTHAYTHTRTNASTHGRTHARTQAGAHRGPLRARSHGGASIASRGRSPRA